MSCSSCTNVAVPNRTTLTGMGGPATHLPFSLIILTARSLCWFYHITRANYLVDVHTTIHLLLCMTVENMLKSIPNDLRCTTGHWEIGRRAPADFKQVFHGPTLDRRGKHAHVIARILALLGHLSIAPRSACIALWLYNLTLYSIYD